MIRITVILCGASTCFHYCKHIEALITDLATGRTFLINYAGSAVLTNTAANRDLLNRATENRSSYATIDLFSRYSYDGFILNYYHDFANLARYQFVARNCADAVAYALDYFFPEKKETDYFFSCYQLLCCWCFLGTCGMKCFPAPVGIATPQDVYQKAQMLAWYTGPLPLQEAVESPGCVCEEKDWDDHGLTAPDSCENALTLAALNEEGGILRHFLEYHLERFSAKHIAYVYLLLRAKARPALAAEVMKLRPEVFTCLPASQDEKAAAADAEVMALLQHKFTRDELRYLYCSAVEQGLPLAFIRAVCEDQNGKMFATSWLERKLRMNRFHPLELVYKRHHDAVYQYFFRHGLQWLSDEDLGAFLPQLTANDPDRAKTWLTAKPGIDKTWVYVHNGNGPIHNVVMMTDDVELFRLLLECKPVADVKKRNKAGETAMSLALHHKRMRILQYLVDHCAKDFPEAMAEAAAMLGRGIPLKMPS